jgi:diacylglycerol O-acyltransferase
MSPARAERVLGPLDAAFLYFERPNQLLHVGCVAVLEATVPFEALLEVLASRLASLPRWRERPVRPALDLTRPTWEDDPTFDVRRHVQRLGVPAPGGESELHALVDGLFARPFDREHPLWEVYLIEGLPDGRAVLLFKVHHCMIDGISGAEVLAAIADREPDGEEPEAASPSPPDGLVAGLWGALANPAGFLARAREAARAAAVVAAVVREPVSPMPFNGRLTDARRITWTSFPLDRFLAMRGAAGCKVNDVVLTVIVGALGRYLAGRGLVLDGRGVRVLVPVNARGALDRRASGNRVSALLTTLPLDVTDPVERLHRTTAAIRTAKEGGQAQAATLLLELAGTLPAPLGPLVARLAPERPFINTVCTNVPGPREPHRLLGRSIVEVHPIVPLFQGIGIGFAILSYAGRLSIAVDADGALAPEIDSLRAALAASESELHSALGLSPVPEALPPSRMPVVADLMTPEPLTLAPDDSLARAWAAMHRHRIRHLPVAAPDGRLLGLVTHRDLLAAAPSAFSVPAPDDRLRLLGWRRAADVMETHVSIAAPEEPAAEAGRRMAHHKIGCLPVVDGGGKLLGIVTAEDFLRWATDAMDPARPETASRVGGGSERAAGHGSGGRRAAAGGAGAADFPEGADRGD